MDRSDVNNASEFLSAHFRQGGRNQVKSRRKVDREYRIPLLLRELFYRCNILDSGIVDKDIEFARLNLSSGNQIAALFRFRYIGIEIADAHCVLFRDLHSQRLDSCGFAESIQE